MKAQRSLDGQRNPPLASRPAEFKATDSLGISLSATLEDIGDYQHGANFLVRWSSSFDTAFAESWGLGLRNLFATVDSVPDPLALKSLPSNQYMVLPLFADSIIGTAALTHDVFGNPIGRFSTYGAIVWMQWTHPDSLPLVVDTNASVDQNPYTWQPQGFLPPNPDGSAVFRAAQNEHYLDRYRVVFRSTGKVNPHPFDDIPFLSPDRYVDVPVAGTETYSSHLPARSVYGFDPVEGDRYRVLVYPITADSVVGTWAMSGPFEWSSPTTGLSSQAPHNASGRAWFQPGYGVRWEGSNPATLRLLDASGRVLDTRRAQGRMDWALEGHNPGWYLLHYQTDQGSAKLRFFWTP